MGLRLQAAERADRAFNSRKKTTSGAALIIRRKRGFHDPDRLMSSRFCSTYRYRATAFPHGTTIEFNYGIEPSLERERTARAAARTGVRHERRIDRLHVRRSGHRLVGAVNVNSSELIIVSAILGLPLVPSPPRFTTPLACALKKLITVSVENPVPFTVIVLPD